jgi:hypothetical protein
MVDGGDTQEPRVARLAVVLNSKLAIRKSYGGRIGRRAGDGGGAEKGRFFEDEALGQSSPRLTTLCSTAKMR